MPRSTGRVYQEQLRPGTLITQIKNLQAALALLTASQLKEAHDRMALAAVTDMHDELASQIDAHHRTQRDSDFLLHALLDKKNRAADRNGFRVMRRTFLNSEENPSRKYWRQIDLGMGGYVARSPIFFTNINFTSARELTGGGSTAAAVADGTLIVPNPGGGSDMRMPQFRSATLGTHVRSFHGYHYSHGGWDTFTGGNYAQVRAIYNEYLRAIPGAPRL